MIEVGLVAQRPEQRPLGGQAVDQPTVALHRMRAAVGLEPADQRRVGGVQEQHPRPVTAGVQVTDDRGQVLR